MRTREEIEREARGTHTWDRGIPRGDQLQLEVLLDIRDLLERTQENRGLPDYPYWVQQVETRSD